MNKWQQMTKELLDAGCSLYRIAKICAKDDENKVKRWAEGRSIPNADEGPILENLYADRDRYGAYPSDKQMRMQTA